MIQKINNAWASLPHGVQAAIVTFVAAAGTTVAHAIEDGGVSFSVASVKHLAGTAVIAGVVALRAFYMLPSSKSGNGTPKAA